MPWGIVYYQARDGSVPAEAFLDSCPLKVEATILAVLEAVRQAPPPQFSGGGKWEAMHGTWAATTRSGSQAPRALSTGCSADSKTGPLGVAEHQQGQPGAGSSLFSRRGHGSGGDGGEMQPGWAAGSAAQSGAADRALASGRQREEHCVVAAVLGRRGR